LSAVPAVEGRAAISAAATTILSSSSRPARVLMAAGAVVPFAARHATMLEALNPMRPITRKALKALNRTVGRLLPAGLLARSYPEGRIHVDDQMLRSDAPEDVQHYFGTGPLAVNEIEESLALAGRRFDDIAACLVLPSGYGRVVRTLRAFMPAWRITAADVNRQAVRFCVREFGVKGLVVRRDPRQARFPAGYDLIFVGSLLTHLPAPDCVALLDALAGVVRPSGILTFTTQGESCLAHLDWYGPAFAAAEAEFRRVLATDGIAFVPYPRRRDYGITLHARSYVERMMSDRFASTLVFLRFKERGWNAHQDVWSYQRVT
jgi:SAM-dependent methyltransferase